MVNQSLRNRDKVKDDAIVGSMGVIKWRCYNEGHRFNAYCSPSANYYGAVILVAHAYGGFVITNAAYNNPNVTGLVYVAAAAPMEDQSGMSVPVLV